jgi:hypothetical protein
MYFAKKLSLNSKIALLIARNPLYLQAYRTNGINIYYTILIIIYITQSDSQSASPYINISTTGTANVISHLLVYYMVHSFFVAVYYRRGN